MASGLGALALFLSVLGLSGLIIYWVSRHRREIGLRMALGADRSSVLGLIVGRALALTGFGVIVGGVGAVVLGRLLDPVLYVPALDPISLSIGVTVLLLAGALASVAPVRRATSIDPMAVLRQE
jgi:ABC-type antimicrobial peptide transport system permease subunit